MLLDMGIRLWTYTIAQAVRARMLADIFPTVRRMMAWSNGRHDASVYCRDSEGVRSHGSPSIPAAGIARKAAVPGLAHDEGSNFWQRPSRRNPHCLMASVSRRERRAGVQVGVRSPARLSQFQ